MVVAPSSGAIQSPPWMVTAFLSAQARASAFLVKPCLVRLRPAGSRYWTRHMRPRADSYGLIEAMLLNSLNVWPPPPPIGWPGETPEKDAPREVTVPLAPRRAFLSPPAVLLGLTR